MRRINQFIVGLLSILFMLVSISVYAQDEDIMQKNIDNKGKELEELCMKINNISAMYPDMTYEITYVNNKLADVSVEGISDYNVKLQLENYYANLEKLKSEIFNLSDSKGVYYVTETEPEPEEGYSDFYNELHSNLTYPETAEEAGIEGIIYVKFVVDPYGNLSEIKVADNIESGLDYAVEDMREEAKAVVMNSSGHWKPAKVGGVPVSHNVVLPIQFKLDGLSTQYFSRYLAF